MSVVLYCAIGVVVGVVLAWVLSDEPDEMMVGAGVLVGAVLWPMIVVIVLFACVSIGIGLTIRRVFG